MKRTADRPLASGRFSLAYGHRGRPRRAGAGRAVAAAAHQPAHRVAGAAHRLYLRGHLHAAQARHHAGHIHRRVSRRHGADAGLDGRARPHRVAGAWRCSPFSLSGSFRTSWPLRGSIATTTRKAGIRMLPVVQPDGWSTVVEALFYAVLMIPVSLAPWRLGMAGAAYAVIGGRAGAGLPRLHHPLCRHPAHPRCRRKAACWRATCSR